MTFFAIDYFIVFFNLFHKINLLGTCNMFPNPFTFTQSNLTFLMYVMYDVNDYVKLLLLLYYIKFIESCMIFL